MINDIKTMIAEFKENSGSKITDRDIAGINKINFELNLLARHEVSKKKPKPKK